MASVNTGGVTSPFVKQMTSMSGSDINLVLGNILLGNAAGVSYSITREKAPTFSLGSPSPQSFSRAKRGIAGSLNMTIYDRSGFFDVLSRSLYAAKRWDITGGGENYIQNGDQWVGTQGSGSIPTSFSGNNLLDPTGRSANPTIESNNGFGQAISGGTGLELRAPAYADQLPPFDLSLTGRNEVGTAASMVIYGVEIVNEGTSHGLNDVGFEGNYTWIGRDIVGWTPAQVNAASTSEMATNFTTLRGIDLGIGR